MLRSIPAANPGTFFRIKVVGMLPYRTGNRKYMPSFRRSSYEPICTPLHRQRNHQRMMQV